MYVCMHVCVGECARMRCVSACVIGVNENENGMKEYEKVDKWSTYVVS